MIFINFLRLCSSTIEIYFLIKFLSFLMNLNKHIFKDILFIFISLMGLLHYLLNLSFSPIGHQIDPKNLWSIPLVLYLTHFYFYELQISYEYLPSHLILFSSFIVFAVGWYEWLELLIMPFNIFMEWI